MKSKRIIKQLCRSYAMELGMVQKYIAASVHLHGEEDHRREFIGFRKQYERH